MVIKGYGLVLILSYHTKIYGTSKGGKTVINIHDYETIILVEGLEDGLTLHQSYLLNNIKRTVWVMTGTSNFKM